MTSLIFTPSPEQQHVIMHRAGHLQVIACAGAGKTEAIAQRVAALLAEGAEPCSIIAFTFTQRAAAGLKARITSRVIGRLGARAGERLGPLFVGTIHAYCLKLLQEEEPRFCNFDLLDDHRLAALLSREFKGLGLGQLAAQHWQAIRDFLRNAALVDNELIDPQALGGHPFGASYRDYAQMLYHYQVLTYGNLITQAVRLMEQPAAFQRVHGPLRHLIVDEYQDINPAQNRLIELLASPPVHLCAVADDDQSIYQWRGSDVASMLAFGHCHADASSLTLSVNRRSRPAIIDAANKFAQSIAPRLPKAMTPARAADEVAASVVTWSAASADEEAATIACSIAELRQRGWQYRDIAVLYRSVRGSSAPLLQALASQRIPYRCAGLTGLFLQPEAQALGKLYAWLADCGWKKDRYSKLQFVDIHQLVRELSSVFATDAPIPDLDVYLDHWHAQANDAAGPVRLIADFYQLLGQLGLSHADLDDPGQSHRLGTMARFAQILADFEQAMRRGRFTPGIPDPVYQGGRERGRALYLRLYYFLQHYALTAYEGFEGEGTGSTNAVEILTVHQAKGLEWPVVFVPCLVSGRFPSKHAGKAQDWLIQDDLLPEAWRDRYEGSDAEERRLFYVALTRARDALYLSSYWTAPAGGSGSPKPVSPSAFLKEIAGGDPAVMAALPLPSRPPVEAPASRELPAVSFSQLALYELCPLRFRLQESLGFASQLTANLGYGRAIHHVIRQLAMQAKATGRPPDPAHIAAVVREGFYLPFANGASFPRRLATATALIERYVAEYQADFSRIWAPERSFELRLAHGVVRARADLVLRAAAGQGLELVDFKTKVAPEQQEVFAWQLAVYTAAARGEGLPITNAFIHNLKHGTRHSVPLGDEILANAKARANNVIAAIASRDFPAKPEACKCRACELRALCKYGAGHQ